MSQELRFRLYYIYFWGEGNVNDVLDKAAIVVGVGVGVGVGGGGGRGGGASCKSISSMNLLSTSQDKMLPAA
jgi:hypothetical protein